MITIRYPSLVNEERKSKRNVVSFKEYSEKARRTIIPCLMVCFLGAVAFRDYFFLNQHNFLKTTGMTFFFIYLCTELNYPSNDIIICGFVVVVYTLYRWTSQI